MNGFYKNTGKKAGFIIDPVKEIKTLHDVDPALIDIRPESRELNRYLDVLKGGAMV
ncbi:hypothetical protein [Virgibacillus profundi]|uniref:hypothetical protein n=1 Tax=Virgibacillus profundi TaxID=2024555 RepID=UPI0013FDD711|nr:hypothetical protein [Virgibacillus profundi]